MGQTTVFSAAIAAYDPELGEHATRVGATAVSIARALGWDDDRVLEVQLGAALHDVGKVVLDLDVLAKPAALDDDEVAHVRAHPVEGVWLVAGVRSLGSALPYILFHHERWDGKGYPTRRAGHDIPVEGRLLAVADAYDAMTSPRPYRPALTRDEAVDEVRRCSGTQFDPGIVEAFLDAIAPSHVQSVVAV